MARCLVTGAGGFVGGYLVRELQAAGHEVVAGAHREPRAGDLVPGCESCRLELLDPRSVAEALSAAQPEMIFHLGAMTFVPAVERERSIAFAVNAGGTLNLLEGMGRHVPRARFLLVSSAHVYSRSNRPIREDDPADPPSFYGLTKRAAESVADYFRREGRAVFVARAFNHIGPGQREDFVTASFAHQIVATERGERKPFLEVGNLAAQRDFTDVRDVVRAYRLLLERDIEPGIYNVASGEAVSIRAVLDRLLERARVRIEIRVDAARVREGEQSIVVGDSTRLQERTGWRKAIPLERSLEDILEALRGEG